MRRAVVFNSLELPPTDIEKRLHGVARKMNLDMKKELGIDLQVGDYFVHRKDGKGEGIPVRIIDGCYLDPTYGRVSNFWSWKVVRADGSLGRIESGYGGGKPHFEKISKKLAISLAKKLAKRKRK